MPDVTTQELMERAQAAADMHDGFVTPTQWMHWATQENYALEVLLARSGYVLREDVRTFVATGARSYQVPVDNTQYPGALAIIAVYRVLPGGSLRRLSARDPLGRARQPLSAIAGFPTTNGDATEWYARSAQGGGGANVEIFLYPVPTSGTYQVYFIPHPPKLVLSGAVAGVSSVTVSYPLGWDERVVLGMARRARQREETDTTQIERALNRTESDIEAAVWSRQLANSPAVRNVDGVERGWGPGESGREAGWPPLSDWYFV